MNMLGLVAAKVGMKAVGTAGSALYGAANAVAKTGQAFGMAGKALGQAAQGASKQTSTSSNNVVIGNFGMAGSAGRQKITGEGTLPAPKAIAKPQVSTKMPTEALLDTAVKYLTSIDKTLKSQIEFDRRSYQEQTQVEREAIIESRPSTTFRDIKDRLSGFKSDVKDNVSTAASIAKFALILGGAAALIAAAMPQKEIDALQQNVDQFKKTFGWLGELGSMIPAGGIIGFLFGGKGLKGRLRGGLIGILAEAVAATVFNRMTGQGGGDNTAVNLAAAGGIGYLGLQGAKAGIGLSRRVSAIRGTGVAMQAATGFAGRRAAVRTVATESAKTGINFLKGPMWKKFLAFLLARGKKELVRKIEQRIAISLATGAVAATGVGAVFGAIGFLVNLGFSLYLMYEIYQLWKEFTASDEADKAGVGDAAIAKEINNPDATKVTAASIASTAISKSETGKPEEAQAFFESKGWTKEQAAGIVGNLVVESGLRTDAIGDGGRAYGIAQWHPDRQSRFQQVYNKPIRQSTFAEQLDFVNWELNNSEKAAGDALRGATTAGDAAAIVDKQYERSAGLHLSERVSNANAIMSGDYGKLSGGGASGYSGTAGGMSGMVNAGAEKMGQIFGMLGSSIIKPGVEKKFAPSGGNVSEQINNQSMKLQNDITFGIKKEKAKDTITSPTISAGKARGVSPVKSVSSIDPNYQNMDVLTKYLSHFRLAA
jgi:hypothetical protein